MSISIVASVLLAGAAPAAECEISMQNWCIARLPSSVSMKDAGRRREWTIFLSEDVSASTIKIVEDKFCDGPLERRKVDDVNEIFQFQSPNGCGINVSVLKKDQRVLPIDLIGMAILFKRDEGWKSLVP